DLCASVSEQRRRDDFTDVSFAKTEFIADRFIGDREIVAAGVKRRVKETNEGPIQSASRAETRRMRDEKGMISHASQLAQKLFVRARSKKNARCWYRTSDPLRVKQVLYH